MAEENNSVEFKAPSSQTEQPAVRTVQQAVSTGQTVSPAVQQTPNATVQQPVNVANQQNVAPAQVVSPAVSQPAQTTGTTIPASQPTNDFIKPATATVNVTPTANAASSQTAGKVNYDNNFAADFNLPPKVLQTKFVLISVGVILILGMLFGCMMSSSPQQVQQSGLGDVVINPAYQERPVHRCGQVEADKACVLYIMNAKGYDRLGRDFFEQAANITGVPEYTIRVNNVLYSEKLIRPGFITQIYIPSRR